MQLQQLRYIVEVAKTGNISAAAKKLFLSQPSLSQQIMKLEKELGIPLFIRQAKSISLTDAGEQFVKHAQRILGDVEQLSDLMQKHSALQAGTLKIGMLWIAGYIGLLQLLEDYKQLYPGLNYSLKIDGSNDLLKLLLARSLHGIFITGAENRLLANPDLYHFCIQEDLYSLLVSTNNPLAKKKIITLNDLRGENIIMPSTSSSFRTELDLFFQQQGFLPNIVSQTSQPDIAVQLVSENLGIGFSSRAIAKKLKTPAYKIIPFEHDFHRYIYFVTLKDFLAYPTIAAFSKYVEKHKY